MFTGCSETRLYQQGQLVAVIQGDCTNVTVTWPGGSFHADTLNHSAATQAWGTATAGVVGAAGLAAVGALRVVP